MNREKIFHGVYNPVLAIDKKEAHTHTHTHTHTHIHTCICAHRSAYIYAVIYFIKENKIRQRTNEWCDLVVLQRLFLWDIVL